MSVAFDAITRDTTFSTSTTSFSHTPAGTPAGVLVWYFQTVASADEVSGVTYGGQSLAQVFRAVSGAPGEVTCWFLAAPLSGTQTVEVTRSAGTGFAIVYAVTVTSAGGSTAVEGFAKNETDFTADPSVSVTTGASVETYVCAGIFSGEDAAASVAAGSGYTKIGTDYDFGSEVAVLEDIDTNDAGSNVSASFTVVSNWMAMGAVALKEAAAASPTILPRMMVVN